MEFPPSLPLQNIAVHCMVVLNEQTAVCVQSTGGSTGEDEDETQTAETRRNTQHNEQLLDREPGEVT